MVYQITDICDLCSAKYNTIMQLQKKAKVNTCNKNWHCIEKCTWVGKLRGQRIRKKALLRKLW